MSGKTVPILCCPEDIKCVKHDGHQETLCPSCEVPICHRCASSIFGRPCKQPSTCLANDFWVGFASDTIHKSRATYLELLCASPCVMSLICFVLEGQRGGGTLHERAHMQRHRVGIRGNVTLFPLPLEDIVAELSKVAAHGSGQLPRTGAELKDCVRILLKSHGPMPASVITQATVRRHVVLKLIEECCQRRHPAYAGLDLAAVRLRAQELPVHGPLPEVVLQQKLERSSLDRMRPQKAATPHEVPVRLEEAFADARPNAVAMEKSSSNAEDSIASSSHAWACMANAIDGNHGDLVVTTSSEMMSLFSPDVLAIAYPFLFKSAVACPDSEKGNKSRRVAGSPRVALPLYAESMIRRIENQFRSDWSFGYSLWNANFRQQVNASRMLFSINTLTQDDGVKGVDGEQLAKAASEICKALRGSYQSVEGDLRPVAGDLSKAYYAPGMSPLARRLLLNASHASREIAGTQEIRRRMRFVMHSFRVVFGMPVFITISPDEKQNSIMLRLCRLRKDDPAVIHEPSSAKWFERLQPPLTSWDTDRQTEALTYELRRGLLARSPLSAADGFRVHVLLILRHIFGMRLCMNCPDCSTPESHPHPEGDWCCDAEGCASTLMGGALGRISAFVGSIEFQKAGAAHLHFHAFLECAHQ